jgi:proline iminopeptidase
MCKKKAHAWFTRALLARPPDQRLAMYIVISKPKRRSVKAGVVHCMAESPRKLLARNVSAKATVCHTTTPPTPRSKIGAMSPPVSRLKLPNATELAWRERGARTGATWLVLHGGPGSGGYPGLWAAIDAARQRAVMPDQRGSGASRPRGHLRGQTASALVADLEALRVHLGLARWHVLAGSWGTVLALCYAQAHPQRVASLVLRGAFALTRGEIAGVLMPAPRWVKTLRLAPAQRPAGGRLALAWVLAHRVQLLQSATPAVASLRAARHWALMETLLAAHGQRRAARLAPNDMALRRVWAGTQRALRRARAQAEQPRSERRDRALWAKFRIQAHLLRRRAGLRAGALDRAVIAAARAGVPMHWLHGECDAVCPFDNSRRWAALARDHGGPATLVRVHSGHLATEPAMARALRDAVRGVSA